MLAVKESLKSTATFENAMKYLMIYGTTNHSMQILSFLFIASEAPGGELMVFTAIPLLSLIGDIAVIILEVMQIEFLIENPWIHKILMMVIFFTQMLLDALVTAIFFFVFLYWDYFRSPLSITFADRSQIILKNPSLLLISSYMKREVRTFQKE